MMKRKGFTLIEMLIYIAILSVVFVVIVNVLLILMRSSAKLAAAKSINNSAITFMERAGREIRESARIKQGAGESVLGSHPGDLWIDSSASGVSTTTRFFLTGSTIQMSKNGTLIGNLTLDDVTVTNLVFRKIDLATSTAVKIELQLRAGSGSAQRTENFYSTIVLRSSY
jgi:prepilin-type N-terminal cleavage/methylation domain-containing protein